MRNDIDTSASMAALPSQAEAFVYPCAGPGAASPLASGLPGSVTYTCEVMGRGKFQKVGIVTDLASGRAWRLSADEGTYLRGTDLAPAPLMHWGAGLAGDVACRVVELARAQGLNLASVRLVARQGFASKGSFVRGEAIAQVFGLQWTAELSCDGPRQALEELVAAALKASPAAEALTGVHAGTFALHANGRPVQVEGVEPSASPAPGDPFLKYREMPAATGEAFSGAIYAKRPADPAADTLVLSNDSNAAIQWHIHAVATYDFDDDTVSVDVGFPEVTGSSRWTVQADPLGRAAPSPLALFSVGTAFCYHTQLCRYIEVRNLPVTSARIVQESRFALAGAQDEVLGQADPLDTHLFTNGRASEEETAKLLTQAERTCYAHRALATAISQDVQVR